MVSVRGYRQAREPSPSFSRFFSHRGLPHREPSFSPALIRVLVVVGLLPALLGSLPPKGEGQFVWLTVICRGPRCTVTSPSITGSGWPRHWPARSRSGISS